MAEVMVDGPLESAEPILELKVGWSDSTALDVAARDTLESIDHSDV